MHFSFVLFAPFVAKMRSILRSLLLAVLAAYLIAAIHSILAFVNKRRSLQRVAEWSIVAGFVLHFDSTESDLQGLGEGNRDLRRRGG